MQYIKNELSKSDKFYQTNNRRYPYLYHTDVPTVFENHLKGLILQYIPTFIFKSKYLNNVSRIFKWLLFQIKIRVFNFVVKKISSKWKVFCSLNESKVSRIFLWFFFLMVFKWDILDDFTTPYPKVRIQFTHIISVVYCLVCLL